MLHRFWSAIFLLVGVISLDRIVFADMTLFDFNQLQPTSKRQANSYMTIESYMEGLYGSDVSVARGAMAAAGMGNLSSPDAFLLNGKGKNSGLTLSFDNSPINSFAVDWEVFRKGTGILIKADGVVIFQDLLTKSEKKTGVSDHLATVFFDHSIHTLEFIGLGKSKIGIDNLAVNIPFPGDGSEDSSSGSPFTDSGDGGETGGNKPGGFEGAEDSEDSERYPGQDGNHDGYPGGWNGNNDTGGLYRPESEVQVPEPATFILFGIGLLTIIVFRRFPICMELRTSLRSRIKTHKIVCILKSDKGFVLTAALTLLSLLILTGTTAYLLTSTDIKVSRNFRNTQSVLQVAIGGAERGKEALRQENISSSNPASFNEELANSIRHGANSTLEGYTPTTDDQPIATGTLNRVSYSAYLTNDFADDISNTTDSNHKVMLTSVATGPDNSKAIVQIVVALFSLPLTPGPGALYSKDNVSLSGSSINISGTNACDPASSLPPVYTLNPATTTLSGSPQLSGNPPTPQQGSIDIDIDSQVEARKDFATTILTADVSNATYGSSSNYVTVYSDATQQGDGELRLNNVTGHGILAVKGDLQLSGNINWTGIILVTGIIRSTGGGSNSKNIVGQIYSGSSLVADSVVSGGVTVGYDSCKVQEAIKGQPFKVRNWKQSY